MSYTSPEALRAALTTRAKRIAAEHGTTAGEVLDAFYFQRLIARVFLADPTGWLLKGGQALLVRFATARYTRDIDLQRRGAFTIDEAASQLIEAAQYDADDYLTYTCVSYKNKFDGSRLTRLTFDVLLGRRIVRQIGVDVVVDSRPLGTPASRPLASAIPIDWPTTWPTVALYPLEDHVADKIIAMYERHHDGQTSSRYRDLVDLVLIAVNNMVDGPKLHNAVAAEVAHRRGRGVDVELPSAFQLPILTG